MPDLVTVIARRWKVIAFFTLSATLLAFLLCFLIPKKYVGIATALAANPALSDRARVFNQSIEGLYTALGSPDELDKVEGTAKLDTVYLALADSFGLSRHYGLAQQDTTARYKAAMQLKGNTVISRTGYGELRIKVWDKNNSMAAALANAALQKLNEIHQQVQTENNRMVLQRLREEMAQKQQLLQPAASEPTTQNRPAQQTSDSNQQLPPLANAAVGGTQLTAQLSQYAALINEYELALKTTPKVLLTVEAARPLPFPDKPDVMKTVMLAFVAALLFSFLLVIFIDSRKTAA
jgi:capsular polysaccharide biosynthesis protein